MRIVLAGIAGGVILFMWGAFSHTVLPLGEVGVKALPNESAVLASLKTSASEPGLYIYPGVDMSHQLSAEEQAAWEAKYRAGPTGILVHHPGGREPMGAGMMITELISNILACLVAAFVISMTVWSFGGRVLAAALFGLVSWLSVDLSYWNWYGFPTNYIMAQAVDQVVGWLLAGLGIAALIKGRQG